MEGDLTQCPGVAFHPVEALVVERSQAYGPDLRQPDETAAGLVQILGSEGGEVGRGGDGRGVPVVGQRRLVPCQNPFQACELRIYE